MTATQDSPAALAVESDSSEVSLDREETEKSENQESADQETTTQATTKATSDDTQESAAREDQDPLNPLAEGEPAPSTGQTSDPRGIPWQDFFPELEKVTPADTPAAIEVALRDNNDLLVDKEKLKLAKLEMHVHRSYYQLWVRHSNQIFMNLVRLNRRAAQLRNKKPLKEA